MAFGSRYQEKMSAETFDFVCTACAEDNKTLEAVKYCVECSGYCCQPCTDVHKKFPALRKHNLMDVTQGPLAGNQQSSLLELPTERCSKHKAKVMDMYCESHEAVGCYVCIAKDHKSCDGSHIHSIPDMIDTLFNLSDCKQTHSLLKDTMISMTTVSKSKDVLLKSLNKAKKEALDKVTTFQKVLEAIVRKAAESSRKEVEDVFKQQESEILNDKHAADDIGEDLKSTDDKLNDAGNNRAQSFVCWKIAQEKITEAVEEKTKHESQRDADVEISFVPDRSVEEYLKVLPGIGHVDKIKESKDINLKLPNDSETCRLFGCCLTHDDKLLVTDRNNKKLKRVDIQKMSVVDYCTLDSVPNGVCCVSNNEVAVACWDSNKIQFVSIQDKMIPTRQLKMSHGCYGIAFNDTKLYLTDGKTSLYIYDMSGTLLKTTSPKEGDKYVFKDSRHITFSSGSKLLIGSGLNNRIACFDATGAYLSSIKSAQSYTDGVCIDGRGDLFVVGCTSHNVVQYSENGERLGVVVKQGDGLTYPRAVCFHPGTNRMFVTLDYGIRSNVLKVFGLV